MPKGPYFMRQGLRGVSGKAILMGSQGRGWLPNYSSVPEMAFFIPGRLLISACLSSSMWAGLVMPGWGSEREHHKLFGTSVRMKCRRSPLLATCHHFCVIKVKGGGAGRDKCLHEVFQCRAEGNARKGIMGVWLGTTNALVIVQIVRKFVAASTEVAGTKLEGQTREPGRRCIIVVAGGDSNVVVLMAWKKVAKLADFEFVTNWKAVLAESAERGGGSDLLKTRENAPQFA